MQNTVIYHKGCADGLMAAAIAYSTLPHFTTKFHGGVHGEPPPDVTGHTVYLLDFSYKKDVIKEMLKTANKIILIDHHKSALEDLDELIKDNSIVTYTDLNRSGCRLAWSYFKSMALAPAIVLHIEDRDLWKFQYPETKDVTKGLDLEEKTVKHYYSLLTHNKPHELITLFKTRGQTLNQAFENDCLNIIKSSLRYVDLFQYKNIPIVNCNSMYSSNIGNLLVKDGVAPFAICYSDATEGRRFSLRSLETQVDVSEIASLLDVNGGGHYCAAGCMLTYDVLKNHPLGV